MTFIHFSHTGYIQASRALMIAAIAFGTFGLVATLAGMRCSKIGGENYILKGRVAAIGGVFFLLQGNGCGNLLRKTENFVMLEVMQKYILVVVKI